MSETTQHNPTNSMTQPPPSGAYLARIIEAGRRKTQFTINDVDLTGFDRQAMNNAMYQAFVRGVLVREKKAVKIGGHEYTPSVYRLLRRAKIRRSRKEG